MDLQSYMSDTSSLFSRPFIISMRKDDKKYKSAQALLLSLGFSPIRFYALEGKNNTGPIQVDYITNGYSILRPGEKGCLMSHMSVIALAATHPNPEQFTMIFEDDITSSLTGDTALKHLQDVAPLLKRENASILHLGKCLETCTRMEHVSGIVYRSVAPSCSHAIAIKNSVARRIIDEFRDYNKAVDFVTGDYIKHRQVIGLNFHPGLFYQDVLNYESGLRPRENQIGNYLECSDCCGDKKKICDEEACRNINSTERFSYTEGLNGEVTAVVPPKQSSSLASQAWVWAGVIIIGCTVLYLLGVQLRAILIVGVILFILLVIATSTGRLEGFRGLNDKWTELYNNTQIEIPPSHPAAHNPVTLYVNTALIQPSYDCFNPNEVTHNGKIYRVARVASRNHSYTILTVIDAATGAIEKETTIDPEIAKVPGKKCQLGIEDMRVFVYQDRLWAIGTCLNPNGCLPSMVFFDLQSYLDSGEKQEKVIPINYAPVMNKPNKNWAPLISPSGELLLVVDFDPLLIIKPDLSTGESSLYYSDNTRKYKTASPIRNSTTTHRIGNTNNYVLLLHSKYIGSKGTVYYQHYFGIIKLDSKETKLSEAFNVEGDGYPPIEYISGASFDSNRQLVTITYGIQDKVCKAATISYGKVTSLFGGENVLA